MLKTLFLALATTVITALPASAENWVLVTRGEHGTEHYIDTESLQQSDGKYLFWRMTISPEPDAQGIVAEKTYVSMICPLRAWRRLVYVSFNARGELVSQEDLGENEPLQFFTSGSVGEGLWKYVC
jgi:hypothetical protein